MQESDRDRAEAFYAHVGSGGKVEADDWMPGDYRAAVLKFVEMHANSELMGVLPERDWILRAPTLRRKLALTSKIQDEVGHAQLLYRVAEDLGKPRGPAAAEVPFQSITRQQEVAHHVPAPRNKLLPGVSSTVAPNSAARSTSSRNFSTPR